MTDKLDVAMEYGGPADGPDPQEQHDAHGAAQHKPLKAPQSERQQQISKLLSSYR